MDWDRWDLFMVLAFGVLCVLVTLALSGCATTPRDGISQREALAITQTLRKDLSND